MIAYRIFLGGSVICFWGMAYLSYRSGDARTALLGFLYGCCNVVIFTK